MDEVNVQDFDVPLSQGTLFARRWTPAGDSSALDDLAPIVLFHDSLGSVALWRSFPEQLCAVTRRPVIAYDRLGYGLSAERLGPMPFDFIESEALDFFPALQQALRFTNFVAFGHSVGGAMALNCAVAQPEKCEAVITESAQAFNEPMTVAGIRVAEKLFQNPEEFARLEKYHGDKASWVLNAWIDTWCSPEFSDWSLRDLLPQVQRPILAIHGSEDEYGSVEQPQMIVDLASGPTKLVILDGIHHVPHREDPSEILKNANEFLSR